MRDQCAMQIAHVLLVTCLLCSCWSVEPLHDPSSLPPVPNPYGLDERHAYIAFLQERMPGYSGVGRSDGMIRSDYAALFASGKTDLATSLTSSVLPGEALRSGADDRGSDGGTRSFTELDAIRLQLRIDFGVMLEAGADVESARATLAEAQSHRREREESAKPGVEVSPTEAVPSASPTEFNRSTPARQGPIMGVPSHADAAKPKPVAPWMAMTPDDIIAKVKGKRDDWVSSLLGPPSGVQVSVGSGNWRFETWRYFANGDAPAADLHESHLHLGQRVLRPSPTSLGLVKSTDCLGSRPC